MKLVLGQGVFEKGEFKSDSPEYVMWRGMLRRCYCAKHQSTAATYVGCSVATEFLYFQNFAAWAKLQNGYELGWQLDKDLLVENNKVYSKETCIFLPAAINKSLAISRRGLLPPGVEKHGRGYRAYWEIEGRRNRQGLFPSPELAYTAYKAGKQKALCLVAEKYRDVLDARAYEALKTYNVERRNKCA